MIRLNKKEQKIKEIDTIKSYHTPSCNAYVKRAKNAIYLNPTNSWEHEMAKCRACYELRSTSSNFITEAVRNAKDAEGKHRRIDIVDLTTGYEIEIETDPKRAKRFDGEENVIVIKLWKEKGDKNKVPQLPQGP